MDRVYLEALPRQAPRPQAAGPPIPHSRLRGCPRPGQRSPKTRGLRVLSGEATAASSREHLDEGEAVRSTKQPIRRAQASGAWDIKPAGYNAPRIFNSCQYLISADRLTLKSHTWVGLPPWKERGRVRRSGWPCSSHMGREAAHGTLPPPQPPAPPSPSEEPRGRVCISGRIWVPVGEGTAGHSFCQQPWAGPRGPSPTSGSRCPCVIASEPLAGLHYAVCLLHPQQDPVSSMPLEFL